MRFKLRRLKKNKKAALHYLHGFVIMLFNLKALLPAAETQFTLIFIY
jgi:hypothetical protein